jgi:hypothetical protein
LHAPLAEVVRRNLQLLMVMACVAACLPGAAGGQVAPSVGAPIYLPPDHWSHAAARSLAAAGLAGDDYRAGSGSYSRSRMAGILRRAAARADSLSHDLAPVARGYAEWFASEYPREAAPGGRQARLRPLDGDARVGYHAATGQAAAGVGYFNEIDWTGARPRPDVARAMAAVDAALGLGHAAVTVALDIAERRRPITELHAAVAVGSFELWAGRRRGPAFGAASGGSVVFSGRLPALDGGGLVLGEAWRPGGMLRVLGPIRFETLLTRIENGDRITRPWLWVSRGSVHPHRRLDLALTRGILFGGEGNAAVTGRSVVHMIIGKRPGDGGYDNQVLAGEVVYRPPAGWLPLSLYAEWGMDDSAGAWYKVPGYIAGLDLARLPGATWLGAGVERAEFAGSCCGNPMWYRHWALRGGWTASGRPLGHPLAGHGREWSARARVALPSSGAAVEARAFRRTRGGENLFAPERAGSSTGGELAADWRPARGRWAVRLRGDAEGGEGWRAGRLQAQMGLRF